MKKILCFLLAVCFAAGLAGMVGCGKKEVKRSLYEIEAAYNEEEKVLTGELDFTYYNDTDNEIAALKFNLFGNAFREGAKFQPVSPLYTATAYYDGVSYGGMEITSVSGNASEWDIEGQDENILSVTLAESVFPDESCKVEIAYALTLAKVEHRTGIAEHAVNLANFYPQLCAYDNGFYECEYYSAGDPFYSRCADYAVSLTTNSEYVVAASGRQTSVKERGHDTERTYELCNARDFCFVIGKEFRVLTQTVGETEVSYYYYDDENAEGTLQVACEGISFFSETFGAYPYPTYSAVQTGFCYGGMEYPALTMISDNLDEANYRYTVVHETAHQWWYAAVGSNQLEHAWMDEGLTEYSSVMFFENYPAYGLEREGLVQAAHKAYKQFFDLYGQLFGEADTSMDRKLGEFNSEYEYVNVTYHKGIILFENLRQSLGDKKFKSGLKRYFAEYCFREATPADMIAVFRKTGVDVNGFFRSYLEGKAVI